MFLISVLLLKFLEGGTGDLDSEFLALNIDLEDSFDFDLLLCLNLFFWDISGNLEWKAGWKDLVETVAVF